MSTLARHCNPRRSELVQVPDGFQSALNPHSPEAAATVGLAWVLIIGAGLIFVAVMALAWLAVRSRPVWLAQHRMVVWGGIAFPFVVLSVLLVYSATQSMSMARREPVALRIEVVGHQWWWRVRYLDANGGLDFETANEIRLPVGRRVELALASNDVLHSFWVPNLAGKLDMIPGRVNRLAFTPDSAAVFRGQCAEYCGGPHAQMALYVVTQPPSAFEQWSNDQRRPATLFDRTFESHCAVCHTVRGSQARGTLGPDLTHVGSRLSIGAGTLPTDAAQLARWIASSQHIKPGNLMPAFREFTGDELAALAAYLASLR
jgi:cytochrome c oxidase subunit II